MRGAERDHVAAHGAAQQRQVTARLKARNAALDADVRDLKQGYEAVEERARLELGMIKKDEVFYQIVDEPRQKKQ